MAHSAVEEMKRDRALYPTAMGTRQEMGDLTHQFLRKPRASPTRNCAHMHSQSTLPTLRKLHQVQVHQLMQLLSGLSPLCVLKDADDWTLQTSQERETKTASLQACGFRGVSQRGSSTARQELPESECVFNQLLPQSRMRFLWHSFGAEEVIRPDSQTHSAKHPRVNEWWCTAEACFVKVAGSATVGLSWKCMTQLSFQDYKG